MLATEQLRQKGSQLLLLPVIQSILYSQDAAGYGLHVVQHQQMPFDAHLMPQHLPLGGRVQGPEYAQLIG